MMWYDNDDIKQLQRTCGITNEHTLTPRRVWTIGGYTLPREKNMWKYADQMRSFDGSYCCCCLLLQFNSFHSYAIDMRIWAIYFHLTQIKCMVGIHWHPHSTYSHSPSLATMRAWILKINITYISPLWARCHTCWCVQVCKWASVYGCRSLHNHILPIEKSNYRHKNHIYFCEINQSEEDHLKIDSVWVGALWIVFCFR